MKRLSLYTTAGLLCLAVVLPAAAQDCKLQIRLWQPDQQRYWDLDEVVELEPGETGHLYLHYDNPGGQYPYRTSAQIGHAVDFGLRGIDPRQTASVLPWKKQSAQEAQEGKLRLDPARPGEAALGYRLTGIDKAGLFDQVPNRCRTGLIRFRVKGATAVPPMASGSAAEQLLEKLYRGVLRRETAGDIHQPFVQMIAQNGLSGAVDVAVAMAESQEFHDRLDFANIERRAQEQNKPRPNRDVTATLLLQEMHEDLYGRNTVVDSVFEMHKGLLVKCLSGADSGRRPCRSLATTLLMTNNFRDQHQGLLTQLP